MNDDVISPINQTPEENPNGTPYENPQTGAVVTPSSPLAEAAAETATEPLTETLSEVPAAAGPTVPVAPLAPLTEDPFKADDASLSLPARPETTGTPAQKQKKPRGSGGKGKMALWVVIVTILLAACAFGVYTWQHSQVNDQANKVKDQSSQIKGLQDQINKLKTDAKKTMPADTTNANVIKIPELGVQFTVPDSLKDLTYTISNGKQTDGQTYTSAGLSTKSLLATSPACKSDNFPLGAITKVNGTYPAKPTIDNTSGQLVKQFTGYYIGNVTPQSACSMDKVSNDLQTSQNKDLQQALKTVAPLAN